MILTVKNAEYLGNYTMRCVFSDGVIKDVDLTPLLKYPAYKALADEKFFIQFAVNDTIFWFNGADIAPEYLYENGVAATA